MTTLLCPVAVLLPFFPALTKTLRALGALSGSAASPSPGGLAACAQGQLPCSTALLPWPRLGCTGEQGLWEASVGASTRAARGQARKRIPLPLLLPSVPSLVPCYPDPDSALLVWCPASVRPASLLGTCLLAWAVSWPQVPPLDLLCSCWGSVGLQPLSARGSPACLAATPAPIPHPALAAPRQNPSLRNFAVPSREC